MSRLAAIVAEQEASKKRLESQDLAAADAAGAAVAVAEHVGIEAAEEWEAWAMEYKLVGWKIEPMQAVGCSLVTTTMIA